MKVLDLFSGIGGFSLGLERAGMQTVAFCEMAAFPQSVLRKNFPGVPIYDDVRTLTAARLASDGIRGGCDVVTGGDPCQPHSHAGKRKGAEDDRFLWPEMLRIVQEFDPAWVINENVIGSESNMVLDQKITDLENAGYECQPFDIPACGVGARHIRQRIYLVAYSERIGIQRRAARREEGQGQPRDEQLARLLFPCSWPSLSFAAGHRDDDGLPNRIHRNKAIGNAVVPQIPEIIGRAIMAVEAIHE